MSIPISQFIPPPLSPLVTISLFSISVTLFLFFTCLLYYVSALHGCWLHGGRTWSISRTAISQKLDELALSEGLVNMC